MCHIGLSVLSERMLLFLCQLVTSYGLEADRHSLRCLFSHIDFSAEGSKTSSSKDFHQIQLLAQECVALLTKPTLISNLCYALDNPLHHQKVGFVGTLVLCSFSSQTNLFHWHFLIQILCFLLSQLHHSMLSFYFMVIPVSILGIFPLFSS